MDGFKKALQIGPVIMFFGRKALLLAENVCLGGGMGEWSVGAGESSVWAGRVSCRGGEAAL